MIASKAENIPTTDTSENHNDLQASSSSSTGNSININSERQQQLLPDDGETTEEYQTCPAQPQLVVLSQRTTMIATKEDNIPTTDTSEHHNDLQVTSVSSSSRSCADSEKQHQQLPDDGDTSAEESHTPLTTSTAPTAAPSRSRRNMLKNVFLLSGMWGLGLGAAFVQIPAAQNSLVYTGHDGISTVPLGLIMLLSAPCAVVLPTLVSRFGEKKVFAVATLLGAVGALVQMTGVLVSQNSGSATEIALLMVGAALQSFAYAATNNIRFAVAYFSTPAFLPKATALVVLGGALGALVGPKLSNLTRDLFDDALYAGNFLQIAVLYLVYGGLALCADFAPPQAPLGEESRDTHEREIDNEHETYGVSCEQRMVSVEEGLAAKPGLDDDDDDDTHESDGMLCEQCIGSVEEGIVAKPGVDDDDDTDGVSCEQRIGSVEEGLAAKPGVDDDGDSTTVPEPVATERSLRAILATTELPLLIVCQSLSYNIMALYMATVQLPMAALGYTDSQGTNAIFAHMLGMFLPSIVSGHLIGSIGTWPSTLLGFTLFLLGGELFFVNDSVTMFTIGIAVVGVGWNISFVGPSARVSELYDRNNNAEKSKVQGFNDGVMLLSIGVFQLSASSLYEAMGSDWYRFCWMLMAATGIAIVLVAVKIYKTSSTL